MAKTRRSRTSRPRSRRRTRVATIRMRSHGRVVTADVGRHAELGRLAQKWNYILCTRARWKGDSRVRESYRADALKDLMTLGVPRSYLRSMAGCAHVEVELYGAAAAAELPWEYVLSAATRALGRDGTFLVTRLLRNRAHAVPLQPPSRVLFIESSPGRIEYTFDSERRRIAAAIGADPSGAGLPAIEFSMTEDLRLVTRRARRGWDVLHLTGVDTHQAAWEIQDFYDDLSPSVRRGIMDRRGHVRDGMLLRERNVPELPVPYDRLAAALVNPRRGPTLVTLNLFYSGARIAREFVRRGAHTAIGFFDEVDDELAERFFQEFYSAWCHPGGTTIPDAFLAAWQRMPADGLHGTAIVIWMGRSALGETGRAQAPPRATTGAADDRDTRRARLDAMPIGELLDVDVEVEEEVNYSLLHNDRPLLRKLTLSKLVQEPLDDISVQVELNVGAQNYPFRCTQTRLDAPQLAMADDVRIPLTASLPRALAERVRSTVYTKVTCGGRVAHESTRRVTLIPADEWVDDTARNPWLPSFVLPRDPAILKIIAASRRYLVGIRDDPNAGFEGYQAVDPDAADPSAEVDAQIRAIWTGLVNEYRLQYINPPPSYSDSTQRLRTPSAIVASNSGTCIDLALLLASCFEYIAVYAVVIVLKDHAFAGYWRSEEAHDRFVEVVKIPKTVPSAGSEAARKAAVPLVDPYGWRLTGVYYDEIMAYVVSGDLVLLEATDLTSGDSFATAREDGTNNLKSRRRFDSLLDIQLARSATPPVTPLPIFIE